MKESFMNIAFIYPPSEQQFIPVPPLGIATLASEAKSTQHKITLIDLELELWLNQGGKSSDYASNQTLSDEDEFELPGLEAILNHIMKFEMLFF